MSAVEFQNLQEALYYALAPAFTWLIALMLVFGIFAALMVPMMALARKLTGR